MIHGGEATNISLIQLLVNFDQRKNPFPMELAELMRMKFVAAFSSF